MKTEIKQIWTLEPCEKQCRVDVYAGETRLFVRFYPADPDLETMKRRKSSYIEMTARLKVKNNSRPSLDEKGIDFETWKRRRLLRT